MYEELASGRDVGDEIERLDDAAPAHRRGGQRDQELYVFPATHYVAGPEAMERAVNGIEAELAERLGSSSATASCSRRSGCACATTYDVEMMRQVGSCSGIENYSRQHRRPRARNSAEHPAGLLPEDFLLVIDESHVTVPQIGAMYEGDVSRKRGPGGARFPACPARSTTGR